MTLRFRFSWCAMPRFSEATVEYELLRDEQRAKRRFASEHKQLRGSLRLSEIEKMLRAQGFAAEGGGGEEKATRKH